VRATFVAGLHEAGVPHGVPLLVGSGAALHVPFEQIGF
jgi:hypothetical protein